MTRDEWHDAVVAGLGEDADDFVYTTEWRPPSEGPSLVCMQFMDATARPGIFTVDLSDDSTPEQVTEAVREALRAYL
jgi:hypothetical protein